MANTTFVQVRVAQALKDEVTNIYDYYGPDLPTVVRIFMKKTVVSLLIQGRRQCEIFSQQKPKFTAEKKVDNEVKIIEKNFNGSINNFNFVSDTIIFIVCLDYVFRVLLRT